MRSGLSPVLNQEADRFLNLSVAQVYVNLQGSCAIADYRLNPLPLHERAIALIVAPRGEVREALAVPQGIAMCNS